METYTEAIEAFNDLLDDLYGETKIGVVSIPASRVLRECDPIAYRCEFLDWLDGEGVDSDSLEGDYPY